MGLPKPPKKPKMSRERYEFLENIRTNDPRHYPDEWADFNIAYKWYTYKPIIQIGGGYKGQ